MIYLWLLLVLVWGWNWGYYARDASLFGGLLAAFWPVLVPLGYLYQWWAWGFRKERYRYIDMKWYQRGATHRRLSDPNRKRKDPAPGLGDLWRE